MWFSGAVVSENRLLLAATCLPSPCIFVGLITTAAKPRSFPLEAASSSSQGTGYYLVDVACNVSGVAY